MTTLKAPAEAVLAFAAHHIELGADRLFIYLDDDNPAAEAALKTHSDIDVTRTDAAYWARKGRHPKKHQVRQGTNAQDAYDRASDLDWLAHIDGDEFLICDKDIRDSLAVLPDTCLVARVRPMEALARQQGDDPAITHFKLFHRDPRVRAAVSHQLYPTYGSHLNGGFLSHRLGKVFARTGVPGLDLRIHNAVLRGEDNPGQVELEKVRLAHLHAPSWDAWRARYRYRMQKGAYRPDLKAPVHYKANALNLHTLFRQIEEDGGEDALRAFFNEVCVARPDLVEGLRDHGLLASIDLGLEDKRTRVFGKPGL